VPTQKFRLLAGFIAGVLAISIDVDPAGLSGATAQAYNVSGAGNYSFNNCGTVEQFDTGTSRYIVFKQPHDSASECTFQISKSDFEVLLVGGGGSGGSGDSRDAGGGGAGGVLYYDFQTASSSGNWRRWTSTRRDRSSRTLPLMVNSHHLVATHSKFKPLETMDTLSRRTSECYWSTKLGQRIQ